MNAIPHFESRQWIKALMYTSLVMFLFIFGADAFASEGTEFAASANKMEQWVRGNLGKTGALICVAVGVFVAAARKDLSWFLYSVVLAIGVGIVVGIVNASFTAII